MSKTAIAIPELYIPDHFLWVPKSRTDVVNAPFDRAALGSDDRDVEALQVGRAASELPNCVWHPVVIRFVAETAINGAGEEEDVREVSVSRDDDVPFSVVWADDGMYQEIVAPTSVLSITTSPGSDWNRQGPVPQYEQRALARLVHNLSYPALKAEGVL